MAAFCIVEFIRRHTLPKHRMNSTIRISYHFLSTTCISIIRIQVSDTSHKIHHYPQKIVHGF